MRSTPTSRRCSAPIPTFAVGAATVCRRVEYDAVVAAAASHFATDELQGVFDYPAHRVHSRELHILARPRYHRLYRVDMRYGSPGCACRERRAARVGEQIQNARFVDALRTQLPACVVYEVPVGRLLGKYSHMFERRERQPHSQPHLIVAIADRPALLHAAAQPPLSAFVAALIAYERCVGRVPDLVAERAVPYSLRLGAPHGVAAEAFELLEVACVEQLVIFEIGCKFLYHNQSVDACKSSCRRSVAGRHVVAACAVVCFIYCLLLSLQSVSVISQRSQSNPRR